MYLIEPPTVREGLIVVTSYIFIPIPSDSMRSSALDWTSGQEARQKEPCVILAHSHARGLFKGFERAVNPILKRVFPTDKLYIIGHGVYTEDNEVSHFISSEVRDAGQKMYTPEKLAEVVEAEGLSKQIRDVRVFSCGSGSVGPRGIFADLFKRALTGRGYGNVVVSGYDGLVRPSYAPRHMWDFKLTDDSHKGVEMSGFIYRASDRRSPF